MADIVYNRGKYLIATVGINNLDLRAVCITGTATGVDNVDLNTITELDAVASVVIHTERVALTGETVTEDDTNNRANIDSANITFAASPGNTAQAMVVYHEAAAGDSTRELVFCYTTGFPQPMDGGLNVTVNDLARLT